MKKFFRSVFDYYTTMLSQAAAEAARDITSIEAASHDEWQTQLMNLVPDAEKRAKVREMTIALVQLGITASSDLAEMVQVYHTAKAYDLTPNDLRMIGSIKRGGRK